jgi:hypothetical protein
MVVRGLRRDIPRRAPVGRARGESRTRPPRGRGRLFACPADALLRQSKFTDVQELIKPDDRNPALESKLRLALGEAATGLEDQTKAEDLLSETIRLDPSAVRLKIRLAELLSGTKPEQADRLIDEAIAADPHSTEALDIKGGDVAGSRRLSQLLQDAAHHSNGQRRPSAPADLQQLGRTLATLQRHDRTLARGTRH